MLTAVARLRTCATGPRCSRAKLQRQTRRVRTYRQGFRSLDQVQTTLPRNVLGGDLLDLLSSRLRAMLQDGPGALAPTSTSSAPTTFAPPFLGAGSKRNFPSRPLGNVAERDRPLLGEPVFAGRERGFADAVRPAGGDGQFFDALLRSDRPRAVSGTEPPPATVRRELPAPGEHPARTADRELPPSTLVRKLEQYWQVSTAEAAAREQPPNGTASSPLSRQGSAPAVPESLALPREAHSWPELTGREMAERIRAFASGSGLTTAEEPEAKASEADAADHTLHVFDRTAHAGTADPMHDLSHRVADILREQAVQHGIDIA